MTPENLGHELATLLRPPADPEEIRADSGLVLRILNAERRLVLVELAGGASVPVPYGVGRPRVGHRYPVYSTPAGDRWLKAGGQTWCKVWTLDEHFNEEGSTFEDDMLDPAFGDQLQLPTFLPFGTGADGDAEHDLDGGDVDLNTSSLVGRPGADAPFVRCNDDETGGWVDSVKHPGYVAVTLPADTLQVGDEVLLYLAQTGKDDAQEIGIIGHWEAHYLTLVDEDNPHLGYFRGAAYDGGFGSESEYDPCPPPGGLLDPPVCIPTTYSLLGAHAVTGPLGDASFYIQRIPQYGHITQTGTLNLSAITCGSHATGMGTGVIFVRATGTTSARFTAIGKGWAGGQRGEMCEKMDNDEWWQESNPGHGKRIPSGNLAPYDGGRGVYGGGGAGGSGRCLGPDWPTACDDDDPPLDCAHVNDTSNHHHADTQTSGGGGGHATAGSTPPDSAEHRRAGALGPLDYAGRPPGDGGIVLGQSDLLGRGWAGSSLFGGGGGSGGDYWFMGRNPDGSDGPGSSYAGNGGAGGGFIALFARFIHNNAGGNAQIPCIDVNGADATDQMAAGGAGGSALVVAEEIGPSIGLKPYFHAETVDIGGFNVGFSGLGAVPGGYAIDNAIDRVPGAGNGGLGRVHVHATETIYGYTANGSVEETLGPFAFAGCWASDIYDSEMLGLDPGMLVEPTTLHADWTTDSDGIKPTFYLEGGDQPDLSDGVIYPQPAPAYWQDGGTHDIDDDAELDLAPYNLAPALYWRVWACLDSGADTGDTPVMEELTLCGTAT